MPMWQYSAPSHPGGHGAARPLPGRWTGAGSVWTPWTTKQEQPRSCRQSPDFCCAFPVPPMHPLGGGPRGDGEGAGGISVKLSGEPCTNSALHKVP